jgi:hypothetical protein
VPPNTLGKGNSKGAHVGFFVEGRYRRHSAKREPLSSVTLALGKVSVIATWCRDGNFSLPRTRWHSSKSLSGARQKVFGKEVVADLQLTETFLPSVTLGKDFAECF